VRYFVALLNGASVRHRSTLQTHDRAWNWVQARDPSSREVQDRAPFRLGCPQVLILHLDVVYS